MRTLVAPLVSLLLGSQALAAQVFVVGPNPGQVPAIQTAVTLAQDGDVILVKSGSYPGLSLGDKSVAIVADSGAVVQVLGGIAIDGLSTNKFVVLSGLISVGGSSPSGEGLRATNCSGTILAQDCSFQGLTHTWISGFIYPCYGALSPSGVDLSSCSGVALTRCQVLGGVSHNANIKAGVGLQVDAASRLAVGTSTISGGSGGFCHFGVFALGYTGGDGVHLHNGSSLYASSTLIYGGLGTVMGNGNDGSDGTGLLAASGSSWVVRDSTVQYTSGPGIPATTLPGRTPALTGSTLIRDTASASFSTAAPDGSTVYLAYGTRTTFLYNPTVLGVQIVQSPRRLQQTTITTGGQSAWQSINLPNLPPTSPGMVFFVQSVVGTPSGPQLSNVQAVVLVDASY